jgi:threonyl-tRNA synthetase
LAPVQVVIATITNEFDDYAKMVHDQLKSAGIRSQIDLDSQKISYKIREHSLQKVPYIAVIGKVEATNNKVSIRKIGSEQQELVDLNEFEARILLEIKQHF